ncbi:MAG TPA: tetratricopeptide repeat protein, partial [Dinghuibacter sp.]|uniref:tetratricopeptide repeat protein n=1 Tax=Dinghuibacter sp. TaxID=2024697 RepID=UPI002CF69134
MQKWFPLLLCLLASGPVRAQDTVPAGATALHLSTYRQKDDLSGWIYAQLQWVAAAPSTRYPVLLRAVADAWRPPRGDDEAQAWQDMLVNEGYALLQAGDIVRSTDAYTSAFQWARGHQDIQDDSLVLENILKPLGNNYTRLGDYEQALFIHQKALSIALALGNNEEIAGTYSNLAAAEGNRGNPEQSLDYCRKGLAMAARPSVRGLLLSQEADAYKALGRVADARSIIQEGLGLLSQSDARQWLPVAYQQAGDIYLDEPALALSYYRRAWGLRSLMRRRERAKLYLRLGDLYLETSPPARAYPKTSPPARVRRETGLTAQPWLDSCLAVLVGGKPLASLQDSDLYAENTLVDVLFSLGRVFAARDSVDEALRCYRLSFSAEKELRNEFISGPARERAVTESRARRETAIELAWDAWRATGQPKYRQSILEFMESSKAQLLLQEVRQQDQLARPDSLHHRILLLERALVYYGEKKDPRYQQVQWELETLRKKVRSGAAGQKGDAANPAADAAATWGDIFTNDKESMRSFFAGAKALYAVECTRQGIVFADRISMTAGWQDNIRQFLTTYFASGP